MNSGGLSRDVRELVWGPGPFPDADTEYQTDCDCKTDPENAEAVIDGLDLPPDGERAEYVRDLFKAVRELHFGGCPKERGPF